LKFDIYRYYPAEAAVKQLWVISINVICGLNDNEIGILTVILIIYIAEGRLIKYSYNTFILKVF